MTAVLRDAEGQFLLPADLIAARFGWPPEMLRDMMRRGLVASTVERGEAEDEGRWRLSVRCGNRRWQAVVLSDGSLSDEHVEMVPPRRRAPCD